MSTYLTVESLKGYLRIAPTDTLDDELLQQIVNAVELEQQARLISYAFVTPDTPRPVIDPPPVTPEPWPGPGWSGVDPYFVPDDVYLAALMRGARLYARRASPEGLVGLGESGIARIPPYDRDIDALEAPWRAMVLA